MSLLSVCCVLSAASLIPESVIELTLLGVVPVFDTDPLLALRVNLGMSAPIVNLQESNSVVSFSKLAISALS